MTRNRAQEILKKLDEMFDEAAAELLEGSAQGDARFSLRLYHPSTQKLLFKASANNKVQIRSLLRNAAQHLKTGGLDKLRASVQDKLHGNFSDHQISLTPNGHHVSNLSHVDSFED